MTTVFKPYPSYKDSGVEWLGEVPEGWEVQPLRRKLRPYDGIKIGPFGSQLKLEHMVETGFKVYGQANVIARDFTRGRKFIDQAKFEELATCEVRPGDVVVTMMGTTGRCAEVPMDAVDGIMDSHLIRLRILNDVSRSYIARLIDEAPFIKEQIIVAGKGSIMHGLNSNMIKNLLITIPPLPEQTAIVRFLGYMDRRIQRLIRAKQKLIKLLEEQKQAIIHEAVTGRIDVRTGKPYPSYKDSGVEWLGEVPEHWVVRRLRNAAEMLVSNVDKHTKEGEEPVRLCNYVDVYKNDRIRPGMSFMRATATLDEVARFRLHTGDVLITKDSEAWNDIGVPALVEETAEDLISGYHIALLRPFKDHVDSEYLLRALQSKCVAYQFHVEANGVTRYGLSHRAIKSTCLPLPPLPEQTAIVQYLDSHLASLSSSMESSRRAIDLLKEYRTRLISDVVTGKVDVREAAALLPDEPDDEPIEEHDAEDEAPDLDEPVGSEEEGEE